jgi:hypothetical protein
MLISMVFLDGFCGMGDAIVGGTLHAQQWNCNRLLELADDLPLSYCRMNDFVLAVGVVGFTNFAIGNSNMDYLQALIDAELWDWGGVYSLGFVRYDEYCYRKYAKILIYGRVLYKYEGLYIREKDSVLYTFQMPWVFRGLWGRPRRL